VFATKRVASSGGGVVARERKEGDIAGMITCHVRGHPGIGDPKFPKAHN